MALTTVVFCAQCRWCSPEQLTSSPDTAKVGSPCPECGSGLSGVHYDPDYITTDPLGKPYVEADAARAFLAGYGVTLPSP